MTNDLAAESKFIWWARLGFVVRGLLYLAIAWLAVAAGRTEDLTGAMEYLSSGFGAALMIVLVVGMTGYGLWRLGDAAFGMESGRHHQKAWRKRAAAAGSGAVYLALAYKAGQLMVGNPVGGGEAHRTAAEALHLPAGGLMLLLAAAVLAGAAVVQMIKVWSCSFLEPLRIEEPWVRWLGRGGYAARGIVFFTLAWLLARAGLNHNAAGAGGLEQALDALHGPLRYGVAGGLALFGVLSIVEARYRSIHKPPTEHIKRKVAEAMPS